MKLFRMQALAGVCLLSFPMMLLAQADPSSAMPGNPGMGVPNTTSGQQTPGVTRQASTRQPGSMGSEIGGGGSGMGSETQMMEDRMFLKTAAQGGVMEIAAGQLAVQHASDERVKKYGQRMVSDHTMLNNELKPYADRMGVQPPGKPKAEDQAELDKLKGLSGADFDKEYVSFMMKDHAEDLKDFRKEASATGDVDLKMAVMRGQSVIERHKKMIDGLGASMGVAASQ